MPWWRRRRLGRHHGRVFLNDLDTAIGDEFLDDRDIAIIEHNDMDARRHSRRGLNRWLSQCQCPHNAISIDDDRGTTVSVLDNTGAYPYNHCYSTAARHTHTHSWTELR